MAIFTFEQVLTLTLYQPFVVNRHTLTVFQFLLNRKRSRMPSAFACSPSGSAATMHVCQGRHNMSRSLLLPQI